MTLLQFPLKAYGIAAPALSYVSDYVYQGKLFMNMHIWETCLTIDIHSLTDMLQPF